MRSRTIVSALCGASLASVIGAGCGGEPDNETDLAKLPPPSAKQIERAKMKPLPKAPPKFGSPPRTPKGTPE